ncbi:hypothetical protein M427DRAFT_77023, partial [Gonapodya prolifera JEL478]
IDKTRLEGARVISQVDNKFIVCIAQNTPPPSDQRNESGTDKLVDHVLLIIDQHAADERCRLEQLWNELLSGAKDEEILSDREDSTQTSTTVFLNALNQKSIVASLVLPKPIEIQLSSRERAALIRYLGYFHYWGMKFDAKGLEKERSDCSESLSITDDTGPIERLSLAESDVAPVRVLALPKSIADRCATEARTTLELVRGYIQQLELSRIPLDSLPISYDPRETRSIWGIVSQCPPGLRDLMNSKACRGAIMFGDKLKQTDCEALITQLKDCDFPFSCAHGRPSMIPLITLTKVR